MVFKGAGFLFARFSGRAERHTNCAFRRGICPNIYRANIIPGEVYCNLGLFIENPLPAPLPRCCIEYDIFAFRIDGDWDLELEFDRQLVTSTNN